MEIKPISVSELNKYMKNKIADDEFLNNVYIKGEISNFKHHYTGHMYFTLKDETSLIKCIMFKASTATLNFVPKDGMKVLVLGTVAVFERDGVYQIYCKAMKQDGIGDLHEKFEQLKLKLEKQGYFNKEHKKKIPFMPKVIGVLSSSTGSVIRDIINVSTRRNPNVYIRLLPVPVQGEDAAPKIASAIKKMNDEKLSDVIILARGGGSLEDLWPFNEEIVAQAIYDSEIPIISAVGHETDFTIADFVADLRAPTPSAGAELAVKDVKDITNYIDVHITRLKLALKKKLELSKLKFNNCMRSKAYTNALQRVNESYMKIDIQVKSLENSIKNINEKAKNNMVNLVSKLDALSPLKTLSRGYCITQVDGKVLNSSKQLKKDMEVDLKFCDGIRQAKVL